MLKYDMSAFGLIISLHNSNASCNIQKLCKFKIFKLNKPDYPLMVY